MTVKLTINFKIICTNLWHFSLLNTVNNHNNSIHLYQNQLSLEPNPGTTAVKEFRILFCTLLKIPLQLKCYFRMNQFNLKVEFNVLNSA